MMADACMCADEQGMSIGLCEQPVLMQTKLIAHELQLSFASAT